MDRNSKFVLSGIICLILTFSAASTTAVAGESEHRNRPRPNIVLVYADDVDCETVFNQFPQQNAGLIAFSNLRELALSGTRFTNFHVTTPVCGPSRACLYSGQYAHHNGCRVNDSKSRWSLGFKGGYKTFDPDDELAYWMKRSGYSTAHVGKYLHEDFKPDYKNGIEWKDIVPRGWDHFRLTLGCDYFGFHCYTKFNNQIAKSIGEYRTDWDIRNAVDVIRVHAKRGSGKPLFLCWAPIAAHVTGNAQPMIAPRHSSLFRNAQIPEAQSRMDAIAFGQTKEMKHITRPTPQRVAYLTEVYRDRLRSIQSIDEGLGSLRRELRDQGMLDNTIFIFTSDHGFRFAQHRHYGKRLPYDRITRGPFIVSGPDIPRNSQCDALLANIDIAPTLVRIAGGEQPSKCDGVSFASLLTAPDRSNSPRKSLLIENWSAAISNSSVVPSTYSSIRTKNEIYTEWASGGREYYDLKQDPEQLVNLYSQIMPATKKRLNRRLRDARRTDSPPQFAQTQFTDERICSHRICASIAPVEFWGHVEADAGIQTVELEIRCVKSGQYWNGIAWSNKEHLFPAKVDQPNGVLSRWSCLLDTSEFSRLRTSNLSARNVTISIVGTDSKNRKTHSKNEKALQLAFADPNTVIDFCQYDSSEKQTLTVQGRATDLETIKHVRIGLQDPVTKEYWTGLKWQKEHHHIESNVEMLEDADQYSHRWSLSVPIPQTHRVLVIAKAINHSKNSDRTPAIESMILQASNQNVQSALRK